VEVELIFDFRDGKKPDQTPPRLRPVLHYLAGRSFSEGRRCIPGSTDFGELGSTELAEVCDTLRIFSHLENSKSSSRSARASQCFWKVAETISKIFFTTEDAEDTEKTP
jgi:hypothetical protein